MDCGIWRLDSEYLVFRLRGSEYRLSNEEFKELTGLVARIIAGEEEALSPEYSTLRSIRVAKPIMTIDLKELGLI